MLIRCEREIFYIFINTFRHQNKTKHRIAECKSLHNSNIGNIHFGFFISNLDLTQIKRYRNMVKRGLFQGKKNLTTFSNPKTLSIFISRNLPISTYVLPL